MKTIHISLSPNVERDDLRIAAKSLLSPWSWRGNNKTARAEKMITDRLPGASVVLTSSGRSALFAVLSALGIKNGDEVIVQAFTCVTVPAAVQWVGAKPVYADIDPKTYNLDPASVAARITPRTRAIIIQHTFGLPAPVDELKEIARQHHLLLIEDCAHAFGAGYHGQPVGILGDAAILSFGRDKMLSCVFGGAVVSRNRELIERIRQQQQDLPLPPSWWNVQQLLHPLITTLALKTYASIGKPLLFGSQKIRLLSKAVTSEEKAGGKPSVINWRFSPALAPLLLNQLRKFPRMNKRRREIASRYLAVLSTQSVQPLPDTSPSWLRFPWRPANSVQLLKTARRAGIILGDWYRSPVAPADADASAVGYAAGSCPQDEKAAQEIINLPTNPTLSDKDVERIISLTSGGPHVHPRGIHAVPYNGRIRGSVIEIEDKNKWNEFISSLSPNTFLQTWEWGEVQQKTGEGVIRLLVGGDSNPAAAQIVIVNAKRGRHYLIPHGPIARDEAAVWQALPAIINYLKNRAPRDGSVALRLAPLIISSPKAQQRLRQLGFRPAPLHVHTELTWLLDIPKTPEAILAGMRKTTRHAIRKAAVAGVLCSVDQSPALVERFWPLYNETRTRHGFIPFSRSFLQAQVDAFLSSRQLFAVFARYQGRDVAAGIFVQSGSTVFYHHGASTKLDKSIPAAHAVQWAAIEEARRRGATRYNFWGIAPDDQPNHPFAGITVFKRGFGGYAIDYLHAQDLPLSTFYTKLWLVDYWRKVRRGF